MPYMAMVLTYIEKTLELSLLLIAERREGCTVFFVPPGVGLGSYATDLGELSPTYRLVSLPNDVVLRFV